MAGEAAADDLAGRGVESGEQRQGAVAFVVVAAPFGLTGAHRQQRLGPVEGLDLALLVDAQDQRPFRRIEIEPDNIANLLYEERVARQLEALRTVRLQPEGTPDAVDRRRRIAGRPRHAV